MCGIAGIIQSDPGGYQKEQVQKMSFALTHRGPDGEGSWCNEDNTVLLVHRRLSVIDLSDAGIQPMSYLDRYHIIHNGEIYNYLELRLALKKKGYSFRSQTDTEVIAAAYDHWKEDCLLHFDGMFAFAIWDEKEKTLFAARDRFGEKPFFYCARPYSFLFASEMKALWEAGIPKQPNEKMLFNFITIGYTDNPEKREETFYQNIYKLPPASYLKLSFVYFTVSVNRYWDIESLLQDKKITDEQAVEKFSELFVESVKKRLRSDVKVGASLSGGLDSSSVATAMKQHITGFQTFTASFHGFEKDESVYAREITAALLLENNLIGLGEKELIEDFEKLCYHQEEPFGSASIFAQYEVYRLAREHGIKVMLDGQGADEILAGYHKYYHWYWEELFRHFRLARSGEIKAARQNGVEEKFGIKNAIAALFPPFASIVMERQYLLKALRQEDLTKDFVRQQSREAYYSPPDHFNLNGVLYFNTMTHGLEELLRYADRNSMAHGCETRLPFLSHELVEFVFSLPSQYKIRKGFTKWILRESMRDQLPAGIAWRTDKIGFEPPQKKWMENQTIQSMIFSAKERLVKEKILKPETLNKKIKPAAAHEADNFDWRYLTSSVLFA